MVARPRLPEDGQLLPTPDHTRAPAPGAGVGVGVEVVLVQVVLGHELGVQRGHGPGLDAGRPGDDPLGRHGEVDQVGPGPHPDRAQLRTIQVGLGVGQRHRQLRPGPPQLTPRLHQTRQVRTRVCVCFCFCVCVCVCVCVG